MPKTPDHPDPHAPAWLQDEPAHERQRQTMNWIKQVVHPRDPHAPLWLRRPLPISEENFELMRLRADGFKVVDTKAGTFARRGRTLILMGRLRENLRAMLHKAQDGICLYCQEPMTLSSITIEHKTALARGGNWKRYNLGGSCDGCNKIKGDVGHNEFLAMIEASRTAKGKVDWSVVRNMSKVDRMRRDKRRNDANNRKLRQKHEAGER